MGIRVALHHKTVYEYDRLVTLSPQIVRLRLASTGRFARPDYWGGSHVDPSGI